MQLVPFQAQITGIVWAQRDIIRARPREIEAKQHNEGRGVVPDWADTLTAHIDVHDDLLYWAVCAGNKTMQMGLIDRQTFPKQKQLYFKHNQAYNTFERLYPHLPTKQDRIRAALNELVSQLHPTQKPLALMQWSIGHVKNVETVLDPFCGAGTTLLAAKLSGLKAVGIEVSEAYCEAAVKRLASGR